MRILIADDHSLFADALKTMIEVQSPDSSVDLVQSVAGALEYLENHQPDLVIMDLKMPHVSGLEGMQQIKEKYTDIPVAIMSGLATRDDVHHCMQAGAAGFFPKTLGGKALLGAIQLVLTGEPFVPTNQAANEGYSFNAKELNSGGSKFQGRDVHLTVRERDVLRYLLKGSANKVIARELDISIVTVKLHVRNLCQKLNANNRTQAALHATELGLVTEEDLK